MSDSFVQVAPDSTGKKLDTSQLAQGGGDVVQRQRTAIASDTDVNARADVVNATPTTQYGLVTRNIPSGTQATSVADGSNVVEGVTSDAAVTGDNPGTLSAKIRGLNKILFNVWDSVNSRLNVFIQNATLAVTQSGVWTTGRTWTLGSGTDSVTTVPSGTQTVSGTVIANQGTAAVAANKWPIEIVDSAGVNIAAVTATNALKVDGSAVTQPVSGTVTTTPPANASTNVAQFGGNNVATGTGASGVGVPRVTVANDSAVIVSGSVTANAGTNLNTSALALDSTVAKDASLTTIDTDIKASQPRKIQDSAGASITVGQKASATSVPVVIASDQSSIPVTSTASNASTRSDTFTGTGNGVTVSSPTAPKSFGILVKGTGGSATTWDVRLEGSLDNVNFSAILQHTNTTGDGTNLWSGASLAPSLFFRSRVAGLVLGAATNVVVTIVGV